MLGDWCDHGDRLVETCELTCTRDPVSPSKTAKKYHKCSRSPCILNSSLHNFFTEHVSTRWDTCVHFNAVLRIISLPRNKVLSVQGARAIAMAKRNSYWITGTEQKERHEKCRGAFSTESTGGNASADHPLISSVCFHGLSTVFVLSLTYLIVQ